MNFVVSLRKQIFGFDHYSALSSTVLIQGLWYTCTSIFKDEL